MPTADIDSALRRAEDVVKKELQSASRNLQQVTGRFMQEVANIGPAHVRDKIFKEIEEISEATTSHILSAMGSFRRGAAVLAMERMVDVEARLKKAGYSHISRSTAA